MIAFDVDDKGTSTANLTRECRAYPQAMAFAGVAQSYIDLPDSQCRFLGEIIDPMENSVFDNKLVLTKQPMDKFAGFHPLNRRRRIKSPEIKAPVRQPL